MDRTAHQCGYGFLLLVLSLGVVFASGVHALDEKSPGIDLPRRSDLETTLKVLERVGPPVGVADASEVPAELSRDLAGTPLPSALEQISVDFDRCVLLGSRTLVLQRRFGSPLEGPALELEELQQVAQDADRLLAPVTPVFAPGESATLNSAFVASLTLEQQQRMLTPQGLPVSALSPEQFRNWSRINNRGAYFAISMEARRASECLQSLSRSSFKRYSADGVPVTQLEVQFMSPTERQRSGVMLMYPWMIERRRKLESEAEIRSLLVSKTRPSASLAPQWQLPCTRQTLKALLEHLRKDGGPRVECPPYARERELWVYSRSGTRAEVLGALCDLWGWTLTKTESGYALGRPRFAPAASPADLHRKLQALLPPALCHQIKASRAPRSNTARTGREMDLILAEVEGLGGKDWNQLEVGKLAPVTQRRLANLIARQEIKLLFQRTVEWDRPPNWVQHPERAVLTLSGPLGPDQHPLLFIGVPDEPGRSGGWGWKVNTARHEYVPRASQ